MKDHLITEKELQMSDSFESSPEHEAWTQSGGRDEDERRYIDKYNRRIRLEDIEAEKSRNKKK